ncbi:hypothetical protein CPB84DRAFT_1776879 [Gymnopilus junonius]|uniref:CBM1 domain-containing protein n=1 Tax=Gymnopilus junonius TaxID=109634 RepID=A0A9P5TNN8_GYMJU|nr:hypothetical protein CPB84DRAFT_1776879 [Gymnopilus junonius]
MYVFSFCFLAFSTPLLLTSFLAGGGKDYHGTTKCADGAYCRYFSDCTFFFRSSFVPLPYIHIAPPMFV